MPEISWDVLAKKSPESGLKVSSGLTRMAFPLAYAVTSSSLINDLTPAAALSW